MIEITIMDEIGDTKTTLTENFIYFVPMKLETWFKGIK